MSNKKEGQTEEFNHLSLRYIVLLVALALASLLFAKIWFSFLPDASLTINKQRVDITVADSTDERAKGLSGRPRLSEAEGMLFKFSSEEEYCFWMKDMNFAIDIIWLDKEKTVIDLKQNAAPDTYPESFCPSEPAQYVLEVSAGKADQWQIKPGNQATF